jgi:hypothetical protein
MPPSFAADCYGGWTPPSQQTATAGGLLLRRGLLYSVDSSFAEDCYAEDSYVEDSYVVWSPHLQQTAAGGEPLRKRL